MEGRRGSSNKELEFRSWHCRRQGGGSLNKELDFRSWHCGRQGDEIETKSWNLDHGIVEGKRGEV